MSEGGAAPGVPSKPRKARGRTSSAGSAPIRKRPPIPKAKEGAEVGLRTKLAWGLTFAVGIALLLWILRPVFAILAAAAGLAYILDPMVDWLERRHLSRESGIGVLFLGVFAAAVLSVLVVLPLLAQQVETLTASAATFVAHLDDHVEPALHWLHDTTGKEIPVDLEVLQQQLPSLAAEYWPQLQERVLEAARGLFTQGLGIVSALVNLLLLPIFLFYLLRDWDRLMGAVDELIPHRYRAQATRVAKEVDQRLSAFVRGQITVAALLGVMYAIGLLIVGIDLAIPVGLISGFLFIIPYLGNALGMLIACFLAVVKFGVGGEIVGVIAVFVVVQVIEGNFLTPRIVGNSVGLHPLVVMIALIVGGSLLGIWGMMLAIPITAVGSVVANEWLAHYRSTPFYSSAGTNPQEAPNEPDPEPS